MTSEKSTIFQPCLVRNTTFQLSAHTCGKHVVREIAHILPTIELSNLIAVITMQKSEYELVNWGPDIDKEKDDLLENVRISISNIIIQLMCI